MANNGLVVRFFADTKSAVADIGKLERAIGRSATAGEKWQKVGGKMVGAIGVAAAAAGALAVKLGVDGVQAAIAEEAELAKLHKTVSNLGFEGATEKIDQFIESTMYAANVADTDLRSAFSVLLTGTKDVTEAQRALSIALDVSAGTGRDLASVAQAMSRGYLGNTNGLSRLNAGIDKATLKTGDMIAITEKLADTYGGSSSARAGTLSGAISGVQIAWSELQESFGAGVLGTGDKGVKDLEEIEARLRAAQPAAQNLGEDVRDLGIGALTFYDRIDAMSNAIESGRWDSVREMLGAGISGNDTAYDVAIVKLRSVGEQFNYTQYAAYDAAQSQVYYKTAAEDTTRANDNQVASIKRLQDALSGLSQDQSIMEQRFGLQQLLSQGPGKSGMRTGAGGKMVQFTTAADRKEFAFSVASGSRGLASSLLGEGNRGGARNALRDAREVIRGLNLPQRFEENLLETLRTPSSLRRTAKARPGTPETGAQVAAINYVFNGDIRVDSGAAIRQTAKEAQRLAALNRGAAEALR